jgi:hypothetical protein
MRSNQKSAAVVWALVLVSWVMAQEEVGLSISGKGWFQFGHVFHSSDSLTPAYNYNHNWAQGTGAQLTVSAKLGEHWSGAAGIGGFQSHLGQGDEVSANLVQSGFVPYVTQAQFTFSLTADEATPFCVTAGLFPFQYNTDVKNLGAYLFRGPVYPGYVYSEFEAIDLDTTVANMLGAKLHSTLFGIWKNDLIIRSETEFRPILDFSVGYITSVNIARVLEVGAGVNFYRLLASKPELTDLTDTSLFVPAGVRESDPVNHPYERDFTYVSGEDTLRLSHRGTKVMGRLSFDPKPLIGSDRFGPNDLKLYAEGAVIGLDDKNGLYASIMDRVPIMGGFNIPTFGLLDVCALEVEWYGAKFRNDYYKLQQWLSPVPPSNRYEYFYSPDTIYADDGSVDRVVVGVGDEQTGKHDTTDVPWGEPFDSQNMVADNIKWSLYLSRTLREHIAISLQIANDHYRPAHHATGLERLRASRFDEACTTLRDFYMMLRIGFVF